MTLTEASFWTKRFGVIAGIAVLIFVILAIVLTSIKNDPLPPEYLTANYACTETKEDFLKYRLDIPSLEVNSDSENVFELQTDTGKVDDLSSLEIINIYQYKIKEQQLDSQLKAKEIAAGLGFDPESIHRKGTTAYVWSDSKISRSLEVNAKTLNFNMNTNSEYIRNIAKENPTPSENEAISDAENIVRRLGILGSDYNYDIGDNITTYWIDINPDGSYSEAPSLAEAELIRVDLHKTKGMVTIKEDIADSDAMINALTNNVGDPEEDTVIVNDKRITVYNFSTVVTYPNPNKSNISIYVGPNDENIDGLLSNIYRIDFTYWPLEVESCGTYELVSPAYALNKVQDGEGSLVYLNETNGDEIQDYQPKSVNKFIIYNIDIAYYEPLTQPTFLQPIYVISGEAIFKNETRGEFHIFYPAINYDIVQDKIELSEPNQEGNNDNNLLNL
jgi:hypothetical protein